MTKICKTCQQLFTKRGTGYIYCSRKCAAFAHTKYRSPEAKREHTILLNTWLSMRNRCINRDNSRYGSYGGRGITICNRWESFEQFCLDMGPRPQGTSLDRIDNNGHYSPENCRWATRSQQQRNTRQTTILRTPVGPMSIIEASETFSIHPRTLHARIKRGWTTEQALKPTRFFSGGFGATRLNATTKKWRQNEQ